MDANEATKNRPRTTQRTRPMVELAEAGTPFRFTPQALEEARTGQILGPVVVDDWQLPAGAYGDSAGPC